MKIIKPYHEILDIIDQEHIVANIERYGRVCYKSEESISPETAVPFVTRIIKNGHEAVIEHEKISIKIVCDRGVSHEIVRHRIASYCQESTRYCNYSQGRFGNELTFIKPCYWKEGDRAYEIWLNQMQKAEETYFALINIGASAEQARAVLPSSLKTEIIVTMNLREWRHFLKLRTSPKSHPQMREISLSILKDMKKFLPVFFNDILFEE